MMFVDSITIFVAGVLLLIGYNKKPVQIDNDTDYSFYEPVMSFDF